MEYILPAIINYLLGSVSFSYLMVKWTTKTDIRTQGSGNAGATNTLRVLGIKFAVLVLALDIAKGIGAVWIGIAFSSDNLWVHVVSGLAVIVGHNWPIFLGFRGGKGIATTIGVLATLAFLPALYAGIIAIALVAITRYVSLGSLVFTALTPISLLITQSPDPYLVASVLIFIFAWIRHRTNIVKLIKGKENKLGAGKTKEG